MRTSLRAFLVSGVVFSFMATEIFAGTISGTVKYGKGDKPKEKPIQMGSDPVCAKTSGGKVMKNDLVVNDNGTVAYAFAYLSAGVDKGKVPKPGAAVTMDQKGCMYHPHIIGVQTGQTLKILNSDPTLHNVHSLAKKNASDNFNNGMVANQSIEKSFKNPETMIKVKCDVHGWMISYIGVLEHPYFATSDTTGAFKIDNVPPGKYTLTVWHEKLKPQTAEVTVADGTPANVAVTLN